MLTWKCCTLRLRLRYAAAWADGSRDSLAPAAARALLCRVQRARLLWMTSSALTSVACLECDKTVSMKFFRSGLARAWGVFMRFSSLCHLEMGLIRKMRAYPCSLMLRHTPDRNERAMGAGSNGRPNGRTWTCKSNTVRSAVPQGSRRTGTSNKRSAPPRVTLSQLRQQRVTSDERSREAEGREKPEACRVSTQQSGPGATRIHHRASGERALAMRIV